MAATLKKAKGEIVAVLRNFDQPAEFVSFVQRHTIEKDGYDLNAALESLQTAKDVVEVCDSLFAYLHAVMDKRPHELSNEDQEKENRRKKYRTKEAPLPVKDFIASIGAITLVAKLMVENDDQSAPESLFNVVRILHDMILEIGGVAKGLQSEICAICETWYLQKRDSAALLVPQMLPVLIDAVLDKDSPATDLKRLYKLRDALKELDVGDATSDNLRQQLLRCVIHPYLLLNPEGKKFIAHLMVVDHRFVDAVHRTVKSVLPYSKRGQVQAYAEIYYRAWKTSNGQSRLSVEHTCIQELIHIAIHARNATVLKQVQAILKYIVEQKHGDRTVEEMLERLYGPILWRSMEVANPLVRENALIQFALVFPLVRADQPQREIDEALSMGFSSLSDCLADSHPNVRQQAVLAIGRILSLYWELLPSHTIQALLEQLTQDVAFDRSSPAVRESVIRALIVVVDNHLAHATMKHYLPKLAPLIHDTSEKVRLQFATLLNTVRKVKAIKFYQIVPVEALVKALATEKADKIRDLLAVLLTSTYWPYARKEVQDLVHRCATLVSTDADSAVAFYESLDLARVPVDTVVGFITRLYDKIVSPWLLQRDSLAEGKAPKEKKAKANEYNIGEEDIHVITAALEIIATMWDKIDSKLLTAEGRPLVEQLLRTFTDANITLMDRHARADSVFRISAHIPATHLLSFSKAIFDRLPEEDPHHAKYLQCLFAWDSRYRARVLNHLTEWLGLAFEDVQYDSKQKSLYGKKKRADADEIEAQASKQDALSKVRLALRILQSMMTGSDWVREETIESEELRPVLDVLLRYREFAERLVEDGSLPMTVRLTEDDILGAVVLYCKLQLHIASATAKVDIPDTATLAEQERLQQQAERNQIEKAQKVLGELTTWTQAVVFEQLKFAGDIDEFDLEFSDDEDNATKPKNMEANKFAYSLTECVVTVAVDQVLLGLAASAEVVVGVTSLLEKLLLAHAGKSFLEKVVLASWKIISHQVVVVQSTKGKGSENLGALSHAHLSKLLLAALKRDPSNGNRISSSGMRTVMQAGDDAEDIDVEASFRECELAQDSKFVLSSIQRTASLTMDLMRVINEKLALGANNLASNWKALQMVALLLDSPTKSPRGTLQHIRSVLVGILTKLKESDPKQATLRNKAEVLLQRLNE